MSTLAASDHVVVVGAGLAGWRLIDTLRREGFTGPVSLVGDEPHEPYERPPLSKQVLAGKWNPERTTLASRERLVELGVQPYLGVAATGLDPSGPTVNLADGRVLEGTRVAIATGARARPLALGGRSLPTLRTRDDAVRLGATLDSLSPGGVVAILGGGFLGAEVATALKARGLTPVVIEVAVRPLWGVLGDAVSSWLRRLPDDFGVELRTERHLVEVADHEGGYELRFSSGETLRAGAVLAAVGSALDLGWLGSSGLDLDDGVLVDGRFEATVRVAAIGDVARFPLAGVGGSELVRVEHWEVASQHAQRLGRYWATGEPSGEPLVPYFWSDQYGKKIQLLGHPHPGDEVVMVDGSEGAGRWLALYHRERVVSGIVALSQPRGLMLSKRLLDASTELDDALALAPWAA